MRPDQFKKRFQEPQADARLRRQIAIEAARRMMGATSTEDPGQPMTRLQGATEADYYSAKRKAAAVLGRTVRPADLPTDAEVLEQALALIRADEDDDQEDDGEDSEDK